MVIKEGTSGMYNHNRLMRVAFDGIGPFPMKKIEQLRASCKVRALPTWMLHPPPPLQSTLSTCLCL